MSPPRVRRDRLDELTDLPNVGPRIAACLFEAGIDCPTDLKDRDAFALLIMLAGGTLFDLAASMATAIIPGIYLREDHRQVEASGSQDHALLPHYLSVSARLSGGVDGRELQGITKPRRPMKRKRPRIRGRFMFTRSLNSVAYRSYFTTSCSIDPK